MIKCRYRHKFQLNLIIVTEIYAFIITWNLDYLANALPDPWRNFQLLWDLRDLGHNVSQTGKLSDFILLIEYVTKV